MFLILQKVVSNLFIDVNIPYESPKDEIPDELMPNHCSRKAASGMLDKKD